MRKGLSTTVGFMIFLFVLLTALIPLALLILSEGQNEQFQIQVAQQYRNVVGNQYNDFLQYSFSGIVFIYDSTTNTVFFVETNGIPSPIIIKYLMVFNGTKWILLSLVKEKSSFIAKPEYLNTSLEIQGNTSIQLPNNIRPYDNQSIYVVAVTQYGNAIFAVPYSLPINYYIFEGAILPFLDLPYSYLKNTTVSFAYPAIIHYYNTSDAFLYWDGINSYKPYECYNGTLHVHLNGIWFNTTNIPKASLNFDNLTSNYIDMNVTIPVLQLSSSEVQYGGGEVFWNQTYFANENISLEFIATYTAEDLGSGGGLVFYLFTEPELWNLSAVWNSSALFPQSYNYTNFLQPLIFFPKSSSPYLALSWSSNGWSLFVYNVTSITKTSERFVPQPGDFILFKISYIPRTNELLAVAYNYNTSQKSVAVFNLSNVIYPFDSGDYAFGVASFNHGVSANWGLIYANVPALRPLFDSQLQMLFYNAGLAKNDG